MSSLQDNIVVNSNIILLQYIANILNLLSYERLINFGIDENIMHCFLVDNN